MQMLNARFPPNPKIEAFKSKLNKSIKAVLEGAMAAWQKGAQEQTRRLLFEYLSIYPDHPKAFSLKEKLEMYDREKAAKLTQNITSVVSVANKKKLEKKAGKLLKQGRVEHAIGILEGLAAASFEDVTVYRETIGDVRFDQDDFASAAWHYKRALKKSINKKRT